MKSIGFKRVLVTKGDFGFAPANLPLYTIKKDKGRKVRRVYNTAIKPGMLVLWKTPKLGEVPKTTVPDSLVATDLGKLHLGVAHSSKRNGIVDSIREAGAGELGACNIDQLGGFGPTCPLSEIKAIYPKCLSCDGLSVKITLDDNHTRSYHQLRTAEERIFNYTPDCKECDSCDRTPTCDEYMCGLVDAINGNLESLSVDGLPYPGIEVRDYDKKYRAVKLHPTFNAYCLTPEGTECEDCFQMPALTTFTVNGNTYNFEGVTNPADDTKTLTAQLEEAARQIEDAFKEEYGRHGGWVVLTKGIGRCCGIQLYVSTCDTGFSIAGLTPCADAINPFPTFEKSSFCEDCNSTTTSNTPTCGLAVITKLDDLDCFCYVGEEPEYKGRHITVDIYDSNQVISSNYDKAVLQEGRMPSNFGTQVQLREYHQLVGGDGFDYFNQGNTYSGKLGLPDRNSQLVNMITAECPVSYCTYFFKTNIVTDTFVRPERRVQRSYSEINVPQGDTTTRFALETFGAKMVELNPNVCSDLTQTYCDETATPDPAT